MPWRLDWTFSGLAKRVEACFTAISQEKINLDIYCLGPQKKGTYHISQVQVNTISQNDIFSPLCNSIAFSHEFAKRVAKKECDVLHCFNTTSLFLTNRNYLFQTTNPTYAYALDAVRDEYPETDKYQRLLNYYATVAELERLEYEKAELIIANSDVVKNNIVKYYSIEESKIEVIPNGVSPQECVVERSQKQSNDLKIVIFPGTMHIMKGFYYLVYAMTKVRREFPNTILLVCGTIHPYESEIFSDLITRMRKESGIILAGFLPREQLFKYFQLADVCCIPLLFGNMSNAILEAVAHGLPIVTTIHSGFPQVDEVGLTVPPKNSDAIADAIITLLSDPQLREKKSLTARKIIKHYHWNIIAKKFINIYQRMQEKGSIP